MATFLSAFLSTFLNAKALNTGDIGYISLLFVGGDAFPNFGFECLR